MRLLRRRNASSIVKEGIPSVFPRVWRFAFALAGTRERADDLAQSTCLRAIEKASQFKPGTQLDRWMFRITHNLWISELRKETVRRGGGLVQVEDAELPNPSQTPEETMMLRDVMLAVLRLPEAQRAAVIIVYVEGYSYKDAAMILDIPIGTVMSRLATARATLGHTFKEQVGLSDAR